MTNETTIAKLTEMKLCTMADAYREQLQDSAFSELSFEERLGILVAHYILYRVPNGTIIFIQKAT